MIDDIVKDIEELLANDRSSPPLVAEETRDLLERAKWHIVSLRKQIDQTEMLGVVMGIYWFVVWMAG